MRFALQSHEENMGDSKSDKAADSFESNINVSL